MLSWGQWRPDVGGPNTGMAVTADGVLPQSAGSGIGYGPMDTLVTETGAVALGTDARGGISIQRQDGGWQTYFATSSKIRLATSTYSWSDIETGRTVPTAADVSFAQFGTKLLNSDASDGFKAYDYEAGGTNDAVSGAPAAEEIAVCNNVVFALACDGNNRRMESSAQGDHSNWTTQGADGKTFEDGGALKAFRDMRNGAGLVWQENAIRLVQFGGAPEGALYSIAKVADGLGAVSSRGVTAFNGVAWWVSAGGLYELTAGGAPLPIGDSKVNGWLADTIDASEYVNIQATVDPARKMTWFRLSDTLLLGYHWTIREFITASVSTAVLFRAAQPAVLIDDLTGTIDSYTWAIDSLTGGAPVFGALDGAFKSARFVGSPMAYTLQSCAISAGGSRRFVQAMPVSDNDGALLSIGTADKLTSALSFSAAQARNEDGNVLLDDRGRVYAFRETGSAGAMWTYSNGVDGMISNGDAP